MVSWMIDYVRLVGRHGCLWALLRIMLILLALYLVQLWAGDFRPGFQ